MKPIVRIPLVTLVTAAVISLGVIGVHASEQCVRFIKKKRHHTAATLAAWAVWDKAHPNWHPKPVPEAMLALDFACSVPLIQNPVDSALPSLNLPTDFAMEELPPPVPPTIIAMSGPPPIIFQETPELPLVSPPIYSPPYPTLFGSFPPPPHTVLPPAATPEPSSWMLLATSLLGICALTERRRKPVRATSRG